DLLDCGAERNVTIDLRPSPFVDPTSKNRNTSRLPERAIRFTEAGERNDAHLDSWTNLSKATNVAPRMSTSIVPQQEAEKRSASGTQTAQRRYLRCSNQLLLR